MRCISRVNPGFTLVASTLRVGGWSFILESADTNVFEAHKVWLCIRARLQSCRTGPSWLSSATGTEKLLRTWYFVRVLPQQGLKSLRENSLFEGTGLGGGKNRRLLEGITPEGTGQSVARHGSAG
jgi:hypothetical protein